MSDHLINLLPHHLAELHQSGLSDETIHAAGIKSETNHVKIALLLNRKKWPRTYGPALLYPYFDMSGNVVLWRVKPDNAPKENGKPKKYLQPTGAAIRAYFPPGMNGELQDAERVIVVTEGEKKTLAGWQAGVTTIGLSGVDCWHGKKCSALIPDLEQIPWNNRRVFVCFDSDAAQNENVVANEKLLAAVIKSRGAQVKIVRIPSGPNGEKVGLDDFLVANNNDSATLWKLINEAVEPEPPDAGEIKSPASEIDPGPEADRFLKITEVDSLPRLRFYQGTFYYWTGTHYKELPTSDVRGRLVEFLNRNFFKVTTTAINNVLDHVKSKARLSPFVSTPPVWISENEPWPAGEILAAKNTLVHLPSLIDGQPATRPLTPKFFTLSALDYNFAPDALRPEKWLDFLGQLWTDPEEGENIDALQEFFGYCLLPDTRQEKILMLIGPKRSGKGTIARVMRTLVGRANTCAPTLASLGMNFGLWPLIGKSLAIISDARLSSRSDTANVVEHLLSISGEDAQTIDRKNLEPITCTLPTRFVILTNELPRLHDSSGALVSRLILLRLTRSFLGQEDPALTKKLLVELPGILLWAIEGWKRLRQFGRFIQPRTSLELIADLEALASPVSVFMRDCCRVGDDESVDRQDLYTAYREWAQKNGKGFVEDAAGFGRALRAVIPTLKDEHHRVFDKLRRFYRGVGLSD